MTCKFYHPEVTFQSNHYAGQENRNQSFSKEKKFSLPKSETPCNFGAKCNKPGCPFKHDVQGNNKSIGKEKKAP